MNIVVNIPYRTLVNMAIRLINAGMASDRAISYVARTYVCDKQSLVDWITTHTSNNGGK